MGRRLAPRFRACVRAAAIAVAVALLSPALLAQRETADTTWQGKHAAIEYTATRVAKHSIDELPVGNTWRLGSGPATTIKLEAPLIYGDGVVAPGTYRAQLTRRTEQGFALTIEGGGRIVGASENADLEGKLDAVKAATKTLEIAFAPRDTQGDAELRALDCVVTFGTPRVTVPLAVAGVITKKGGGAAIDGFKLPAEWLGRRLGGLPTPVATVTLSAAAKDAPKAFNVLLTENDAKLIAHDEITTDIRTPVAAHMKTFDRTGTVVWSAAAEATTHFTLDDAKWEKGKQLTLVARVGARKAEITIPLKDEK
jgi:hypothetical protein